MRIFRLFAIFFLFTAPLASAWPEVVRENFPNGTLDSRWQFHLSGGNRIITHPGYAEICADENTYAYLAFPIGADNITTTARIKASRPSGISWCTSVFIIWNGGNWCQLGILDNPKGQYYTAETVNGSTIENRLAPCDADKWHYLRIELGRDCIRYFASEDASTWKCLRVIERPKELDSIPLDIAVGKGYGRGVEPYAHYGLDNDYSDPGAKIISQIANISVEPTPADKLTLSGPERRQIRETGLDPVSKVILSGKADPTFERVASFYPPIKYPREAVGVPEHPDDIGINYLGIIQIDNTKNKGQLLSLSLETGDPPAPLFSDKNPPKRRLMDNRLPVVTLTAKRGDVEYEQTVFGSTADHSADADLMAYVRLRVRSLKNGSLPNDAELAGLPGNQRMRFILHDISGGRKGLCLRIPYRKPESAYEINSADMEFTLKLTRSRWLSDIYSAEIFEIPEKRVNDAYRAWLAYSLLDVDKINGFCEPHDGAGFYEEIYGYSAALYCIALDCYGMHDSAEHYLDTLLHFQQPDGLYVQNFGLPDTGALLLAIDDHYKLTGDKAWLKRISGNIIKAGDWIMRARKSAPKTGVECGLIKFRPYCDYPEPVYGYFTDTYCCIGLQHASAALEAIGIHEKAKEFEAEARRYRADILASMDAAGIKAPSGTLLPLEPQTHRLLKDSHFTGGDYYGLVASDLLETQFLPAKDKRAYWITDLMERKQGLIAGVCEFMGGIDHAYSYGYLLTQLKRGEARRVILGFYGMLAYGMSKDTYSGVECTAIETGANAQTLPHLYSATQQLQTLRMMLICEDGDRLLIGEAIPRAWLEDGKKVAAKDAPTRFGNVSFTITSHAAKGRIDVSLRPPTRTPPGLIRIRLRHPNMKSIHRVYLNGSPLKSFSGESIELRRVTKPVQLEVIFK